MMVLDFSFHNKNPDNVFASDISFVVIASSGSSAVSLMIVKS